ncbi:hypothetical protein MPTK2_8g14390 [Marchantia polymorpha subsp. ruderalis]
MLALGVIALLIPIFLLSQGVGDAGGETRGGDSYDIVAGKTLLPPMVFGLGVFYVAVMIGVFLTVLGPFLVVGLIVLFLGGFLNSTI